MVWCAHNAPTSMYRAYKIFYIRIHHELEEVLHLSTHHQILIPTLLVLDGWEEHNMVANQEMAKKWQHPYQRKEMIKEFGISISFPSLIP